VGAFREALDSLSVGAWNAAGTMARKTVERCMKDKGSTEYTAKSQIKEMLSKGVITQQLHDWSMEVNVIGDYAAHGNETDRDPTVRQVDPDPDIAPDDARFAVKFARALLTYVYEHAAEYDNRKRNPA
jgi:hypothetical protein